MGEAIKCTISSKINNPLQQKVRLYLTRQNGDIILK